MTPFEIWFTNMARELAKSDAVAERSKPTTIEQRIAVGLVQARAAECRAIAGDLHKQGATMQSRVAAQLANLLAQQSHVYEQIALRLCDEYPPGASLLPVETCECGHTISQHSCGASGEPGPCSDDCSCREYRQKKVIQEVVQ